MTFTPNRNFIAFWDLHGFSLYGTLKFSGVEAGMKLSSKMGHFGARDYLAKTHIADRLT